MTHKPLTTFDRPEPAVEAQQGKESPVITREVIWQALAEGYASKLASHPNFKDDDIRNALEEGFRQNPLPPDLFRLTLRFGGRSIFGCPVPLPTRPPELAHLSEEKFLKLLRALNTVAGELGAASISANPGLDKEH